MNTIALFFLISLIWCLFAAVALAFMIPYEEERKRSGKQKALRHAIPMAMVTMGIFVVLAIVIGFFFGSFLPPEVMCTC